VSIVRKLSEWSKKSSGSVPDSLKEIVKASREAVTALDHAGE